MTNSPINGMTYLTRGAQLIVTPQLRLFVLVPLLINLVLFFAATYLLIQQFGVAMSWLLGSLPGWLDFLAWILWVIFAALVLVVYGYSFSMITNIIAAPFYGILAEKTEILVKGTGPAPESLRHMIPRTLGREMVKLWYFILRGLALLILMFVLSFIPLINVIVPVIGFLWGAWSMAIQYVDYPADNNQLTFKDTRNRLWNRKYSSFSLGGLVMLGTMVPLLNIFVMPIAVVGGTLFWIDELEKQGSGTSIRQ
ncbi:sulfate transporter CysZ [Aestuariicella sp. G3-2]|uniref:sulfate transporter CysZ n=1 Tax=Pseudomaricurvus albidus TaxID=2842452 RepID=UPI001C0BFA11|nr:sulfate transporter CysZ [Aestuariicella albida]MBU3069749.1 sulfate transporter CysZ [Aestuariicella albida]